jgi:hypothetical protein
MKKLALSVTVVIVLLIGLASAILLVRQRQLISQKAAPATTLNLIPSNSNPTVGDSVSVSVDINTANNLVIGAELYINFDASRLEATDVTTGPFLTNPQIQTKTIDNTSGRVSYVLFLPTGSTPQQGQGTVAMVNFLTKAEGQANVSFDGSSLVAAVGEDVGTNVLVSSPGTTFNILPVSTGEPTITPTEGVVATLTPTGTEVVATSTPTTTVTPTTGGSGGADTVIATNTPTATATLTPTSTSTVTPRPTSTSTPTPTTSSGSGGANPTSTPTATFTPTSASQAVGASVKITSITEGQVVNSKRPLFRGVAAPSSKITITLNSDQEITASVTATSAGNWSWQPGEDLNEGQHKITVLALDTQGKQTSSSVNFTVQTEGLPSAGISYPTLISIMLSALMIFGFFVLLI